MKILNAEIIRLRCGCDKVYLHTDLPDPFKLGDIVSLKFDVPCDAGEAYLKKHFPDLEPPKIITDSK